MSANRDYRSLWPMFRPRARTLTPVRRLAVFIPTLLTPSRLGRTQILQAELLPSTVVELFQKKEVS